LSDASPYVGPRPFENVDAALFYGREAESSALVSLIVSNAITLLYAQSGAGKSSLLNASVIPALRAREFEVLGPARVNGEPPAGAANAFIANALASLRGAAPHRDEGAPQSFAEVFGALPRPVTSEGLPATRVVVFDQFEEIFTTMLERWKEREQFFDELGRALDDVDGLRIVLAMREEYVAGLDSYAPLLPDQLRARFRLERLREDGALLAVTGPLEHTERQFDSAAAQKLVYNLARIPAASAHRDEDVVGEFVEPLHLQLVCSQLWAALPHDVRVIGVDDIADLGDIDAALAAYYDRCVESVAATTGVAQQAIREWFERRLITSDRSRNIIEKGPNKTGELTNDVVAQLQSMYLVRVEMRGAKPWVELTHDRFVEPILDANARWRDTDLKRRDTGWVVDLEVRAQKWVEAARPRTLLISGTELARARAWAKAAPAAGYGGSPAFRDLVNASTDAASSRKRWMLAGVGVLVATTLVCIVLVAQSDAVEQARKRQVAVELATTAERGVIARTLAQQRGAEFLALELGIRATDASNRGATPVVEATDGLQRALEAVGTATWLRGHSSAITTVRFSDDGTRVGARGADETCRWEAAGGQWDEQAPVLRCIGWKQRDLGAVSIEAAPSWDWLKVTPVDGSVRNPAPHLYDATSMQPALDAELRAARSIHFLENGTRLLAIDANWRGHLFDLRSAQRLAIDVAFPPNAAIGTSKKGSLVAFADLATRKVHAWSGVAGGAPPIELDLPDGFILGESTPTVLVADDDRRVALVSYDYRTSELGVASWSLDPAKPAAAADVKVVVQPPTKVTLPPQSADIALSADGATLVALAAGTVWTWALDHPAAPRTGALASGANARLLDARALLVRTTTKDAAGPRTTIAVRAIDGTSTVPSASLERGEEIIDADVSADGRDIVLLNAANQIKIAHFGNATEATASTTPMDLMTLACRRIRWQSEYRDVATVCAR